jgi:dynein heavy chain
LSRFVDVRDQEWFHETMARLVETGLGKQYEEMARETPYFVDFLRDAPEPTGEETEAETEVEMPKIYEPLPNFAILEDRLSMFLTQHNEMIRGSGMDLVFFADAMSHVIKVTYLIIICIGLAPHVVFVLFFIIRSANE